MSREKYESLLFSTRHSSLGTLSFHSVLDTLLLATCHLPLVTLLLSIHLSEVPAVQVARQRAKVFREKRTGISINDEGEAAPLGEYL